MNIDSSPRNQSRSNQPTLKPHADSKIARILRHLTSGGSINRFEAERLGDHCLNTTISTLANRHRLLIERRPERVPNRWGKPCRVVRYKLSPSNRCRAYEVLRAFKGATP